MATAAHLSEHRPFHQNVLSTEKGPWLIRVNALLTAHESENASLHLVLEDLSHEPRSKDRSFSLACLPHIWKSRKSVSRSPIAFAVGWRPRQGMGFWTWSRDRNSSSRTSFWIFPVSDLPFTGGGACCHHMNPNLPQAASTARCGTK